MGGDGAYIAQRVRILAGFDVMGFLLLLPAHFHVVAFFLQKLQIAFLAGKVRVENGLQHNCHKIAVSSCHQALNEVAVGVLASSVSSGVCFLQHE